jgi:hypothetical protein
MRVYPISTCSYKLAVVTSNKYCDAEVLLHAQNARPPSHSGPYTFYGDCVETPPSYDLHDAAGLHLNPQICEGHADAQFTRTISARQWTLSPQHVLSFDSSRPKVAAIIVPSSLATSHLGVFISSTAWPANR